LGRVALAPACRRPGTTFPARGTVPRGTDHVRAAGEKWRPRPRPGPGRYQSTPAQTGGEAVRQAAPPRSLVSLTPWARAPALFCRAYCRARNERKAGPGARGNEPTGEAPLFNFCQAAASRGGLAFRRCLCGASLDGGLRALPLFSPSARTGRASWRSSVVHSEGPRLPLLSHSRSQGNAGRIFLVLARFDAWPSLYRR
ncbi:unnamed protein product, partial [Amoebophrya sp. A120]